MSEIRSPDLSDVMTAAEAAVLAWAMQVPGPIDSAVMEELVRVVNAVRAASGQPPIGENENDQRWENCPREEEM